MWEEEKSRFSEFKIRSFSLFFSGLGSSHSWNPSHLQSISTNTMSSSSSESEEGQEFGDMYAGVTVSTVNPSLVSWCPVMDMIMFALDTKDGGLVVYRVSGQVVWSLSSRKIQLVPKKVAWRHDGM